MWLPTGSWNSKYLSVGEGGLHGTINYGGLADGVRRGYATASTDTGHSAADRWWMVGHAEKVIDAGYRKPFTPKRLPWGDPDISGNFTSKGRGDHAVRTAGAVGRRNTDRRRSLPRGPGDDVDLGAQSELVHDLQQAFFEVMPSDFAPVHQDLVAESFRAEDPKASPGKQVVERRRGLGEYPPVVEPVEPGVFEVGEQPELGVLGALHEANIELPLAAVAIKIGLPFNLKRRSVVQIAEESASPTGGHSAALIGTDLEGLE